MTIHTVAEGETLTSIAREYGVSPSLIQELNQLSDPNSLITGQALVILYPETVHTVESGETLSGIAGEYGVSVIQLLQRNPDLSGLSNIYPGQTLVISYQSPPDVRITMTGYAYTYISDAVLRRTLPYLTYLSVFSYGLRPDGSLIEPQDDQRLIDLAREYGAVPLLMLTSLNEGGTFSSELINSILASEALQDAVIENVISVVQAKGYGGVEADFEYIDGQYREEYASFVAKLNGALGDGYTVMTDLAPKTSRDQPGLLYEAHDYRALGEASDLVFLMTYEWGYQYGPPMAVSPINNVRRVIEFALTDIPDYKILTGVPSYGYDWTLPFIRGESSAESLSYRRALELARNVGAEIQFSTEDAAPYFEYADDGGRQHIVWFQDARSSEAILKLVQEYSLEGAGVWNIMRWYPQVWTVMIGMFEISKI